MGFFNVKTPYHEQGEPQASWTWELGDGGDGGDDGGGIGARCKPLSAPSVLSTKAS